MNSYFKIDSDIEKKLATTTATSPVCSYNEWDPLEEVIVGVIDGANVPEWHIALEATMPEHNKDFFLQHAGKLFPLEELALAKQELNNLAQMLTMKGIQVVRPDIMNYQLPFSTPHWQSQGGLYGAMPRDLLLVIGDTLIEAPMAWRSRYFEIEAYRSLLKNYFSRGAKWISAPKPQLLDELFNVNYDKMQPQLSSNYVITEFEPTFDAADFIRCGRDIFVQQSHVTNQMGIEWLRRTISDEYTIHLIEINDSAPMHIDASFMPLAPGKLLLNPNRIKKVPTLFKHWEIKYAPEPILPKHHHMYMSSAWVSMNVLMLDEKTVVVEKQETPLIDMLIDWGFDVIGIDFRHVMRFGGAFHCVTCDIRRQGLLQSYF